MFDANHIPADIWQRIFLFLAQTSGQTQPPSTVLPLIFTDKRMHSILCRCSPENVHLYASLCDHYFDTYSPGLRLGCRRLTSSARAAELVDRFTSLGRIRKGSIDYDRTLLTQDMFRCFFMLLESDQKNLKILLEFARLRSFTYEAARHYFCAENEHLQNEPLHVALLWVLWMVSDYDSLLREEDAMAIKIQDAVLPYVISAWLFPDYPPARNPSPSDAVPFRTSSTQQAVYSLPMFSHVLTFVIPPISPVAILSFCARADAFLLRDSHGASGSSQQGEHFPARDRARRMLSSALPWSSRLNSYYRLRGSSARPSDRFCEDWVRLQGRLEPNEGLSQAISSWASINTRHVMSVLSGIWEGRLEHPNYSQYMALRDAERPPVDAYENLFITSLPILLRLKVFYCTTTEAMLRLSVEGDGILNAWFPPDYEIELDYTRSGDLRIWDHAKNVKSEYQVFNPEIGVPGGDEITDVLVIGHCINQDTRYIGRLRLTDGLVVLLRDPIQSGREVLRGYVHHGDIFVGRWRTAASPAEADNWEGPFILGHRDEVPRTS